MHQLNFTQVFQFTKYPSNNVLYIFASDRSHFCQNLKEMDCRIHGGEMTGKSAELDAPTRQHEGSNSKRLLRAEEKNIICCASQSQLSSAPKEETAKRKEEKEGSRLRAEDRGGTWREILRWNMIKESYK